ncbi:MAG: hypothetical protein WC667_11735 [Sulfurimonas sp.]
MIKDEEMNTFPKLYETENIKTGNKTLQMKFMEVKSGWEWYLTEFDAEEKIAFGFVKGFEKEWGYFSLTEMEDIPTIIRDETFIKIQFKDLKC